MINIFHIKNSKKELKPIFINIRPESYCAEAVALFARMEEQPTTALKELINKTILDLKSAGIWDKTDKFHKWDLHTEQASLLDWKNPELDAEVVGTNVTFAPGSGLLTSATGHIELNYNPSTDATSFTLENAAFSLDDVSELKVSGFNFGAYNTTSNMDVILFRTFVDSDTTRFRPLLYMGNQAGFYWSNRLKGSFYTWYCEKPTTTTLAMYSDSTTSTTSTSKTFTTMVNQNLVLGGFRADSGNVTRVPINTSLFWIGGKFTSEQRAAYYDIINYWKANIGTVSEEFYGIEKVRNGGFDTTDRWITMDGWNIDNGVASCDGTVNTAIYQDVRGENGKGYKIEITISNYESGMLLIGGSTNALSVTRNGTYKYIRIWTSDSILYLKSHPSSGFKGSIDNVSVKELL